MRSHHSDETMMRENMVRVNFWVSLHRAIPWFRASGKGLLSTKILFQKREWIFVIGSASISSSDVSIKCIYVGSNVFGKWYGINFFHNILYILMRVTSVRNLWYMIIFLDRCSLPEMHCPSSFFCMDIENGFSHKFLS